MGRVRPLRALIVAVVLVQVSACAGDQAGLARVGGDRLEIEERLAQYRRIFAEREGFHGALKGQVPQE